MKILILSMSNEIDSKHKELIEKTTLINKTYAKINDYDYKFEFIENSKEDLTEFERYLFFKNKYVFVKKYLKNYDYIVYLDTDACFVNPNLKIEKYLNGKSIFYAYQHSLICGYTIWPIQIGNLFSKILQNNKISYLKDIIEADEKLKEILKSSFLDLFATITLNPYAINGGFLIFKNDELTFQFLNKILNNYDLFHGKSNDEGCIGLILQSEKYKNCWTLLDKSIAGNTALSWQPEFYYDEDKNFIVHNAGQTIKSKIEMIKIIMNNKWWSSIFSKGDFN